MVESALLFEAIYLWSTFLREAGRFRNSDEGDPDESTLLSRVEDFRITECFDAIFDVQYDDMSMRLAVNTFFEKFNRVLSDISSPRVGPDPLLVLDDGSEVSAVPAFHGWRMRARLLYEATQSLATLDALDARVKTAATAAEESLTEVDLARQVLVGITADLDMARAEHAQNELATHFSQLGNGERVASNSFRLLAAALVLAAALWAGINLNGDTGWGPEVAAHLAVTLAIGAGSAYAARLAATHRAMANWALSIEVQLGTVKDFLAEISDPGVKERVYEEFGRRVLGAPPSLSGDEVAPLPSSQIIEIAALIAGSRER